MSRRLVEFALVALAALLGHVGVGRAGDCDVVNFMTPNPYGTPMYLRWEGGQISIGCSGCSSTVKSFISDAASAWAGVSGGKYSFSTDGSNISWVSSNWPYGDDIMETTPTAANGYITSATIEINGERADWWYGADCVGNIPGDKLDFASAVTHELGHLLGLAHNSCTGAVMRTPLDFGDCTRIISANDEAAIASLYCTGGQRVAGAVMDESCTSDNPRAETVGFNYSDGSARWTTLEEDGTSFYVIEGSETPNGNGLRDLAIDSRGVGDHSVRIDPGAFPFVRLVEVDDAGRRLICDVASTTDWDERMAGPKYTETAPVLRAERTHSDRSRIRFSGRARGGTPVSSEDRAGAGMRQSLSSDPTVMIYSTIELLSGVNDLLSRYEELGETPWSLVYTDEAEMLASLKANIASDFETYGITRFHIVGDALIGGWSDSPADSWFGDVDDDGVPDVSVTRWPAHTNYQVSELALKMEGNILQGGPADRAAFLVGDVDLSGNSGALANWVSLQVQAAVPPDVGQSILYLTDSPNGDVRNTDVANLLNQDNPDVVSIISTTSTEYEPGHFLSAVVPNNPWTENLLAFGTLARIVIAASCDAVYWNATSPSPMEAFIFSDSYRGSVAWVGPLSSTSGSWQDVNYVVSWFLMEELWRNPYRPMADSWLEALQRAYGVFANNAMFLETLDKYEFVGDPVSPFSPVPHSSISAFVRKNGGALVEMPQVFAAGCPGGDGDEVVVDVKLDASKVVGGVVAIDDLVLGQPTSPEPVFFPGGHTIVADSAAVLLPPESGFPNGCYRSTFTVAAIGGCGVDSAQVFLKGVRLGFAHLNIRSPDMVLVSGTRGLVSVADYTVWGASSNSSVCNCIHEHTYSACADFVPPDTAVSGADFSFFGTHYGHGDPSGLGNPTVAQASTSTGSVHLAFSEEQPLTGPHKLRVQVSLEGVEPLQGMVVTLAADNPRLTFSGWSEGSDFTGRAMCTVVERDRGKQLFIGVLGTKVGLSANGVLGTAEFTISSDDALSLTESDFALVTADLMSANGFVMQVPTNHRQTTFSAPTYQNELAQNYPNPFNPRTTISFSLANAGDAELRIFDVRGALVRTLVSGRQQAGVHRVDWDGLSDRGQRVASGVYFYKLVAGSFVDTKKMTILK